MERPNKKDYDFNDTIEGVRFASDMMRYADFLENKIKWQNIKIEMHEYKVKEINELYNEIHRP